MKKREDDITVAATGPVRKGWQRFTPLRCSICTLYIWQRPILLREPAEAPEPRREWIICSYCYKALLAEMRRAALTTPLRLRVAVGLVATERAPDYMSAQRAFEREFNWFVWAMVIFTVFHLALFVILFSIPR